jgi:uncharacterized membrane protein
VTPFPLLRPFCDAIEKCLTVLTALSDVGINNQFMKELAENLTPNSSALFVLVRKANPERVLEELKGTGGKILKTSLSHEDGGKLQAALDAAQKEA